MVVEDDVTHLKEVLDSIELFPSEMLDNLIFDYLNNPETEEVWFTAVDNDRPIAIGYCAPEKLTEGTYNLYAIGVKSDVQDNGVGWEMMKFIEEYLKEAGQRILIVETSGTAEFESTRKFYEKLEYHKEAVIRDYWQDGDDKVIYLKRLN
jgi:ribosomal protein S18 acetylase RimI-like enzyme